MRETGNKLEILDVMTSHNTVVAGQPRSQGPGNEVVRRPTELDGFRNINRVVMKKYLTRGGHKINQLQIKIMQFSKQYVISSMQTENKATARVYRTCIFLRK